MYDKGNFIIFEKGENFIFSLCKKKNKDSTITFFWYEKEIRNINNKLDLRKIADLDILCDMIKSGKLQKDNKRYD